MKAKQVKTTPKITAQDLNALYESQLQVDPDVRKEIEDKGMVMRWINATELQKKHGFHRSGWKPYKREGKTTPDSIFGGNPEGYICRGDLVLAVKPIEAQDRHRAILEYKANLYKSTNQEHAKKLRREAAQAGIKMKIMEGYESEGDTEDSSDEE